MSITSLIRSTLSAVNEKALLVVAGSIADDDIGKEIHNEETMVLLPYKTAGLRTEVDIIPIYHYRVDIL